MKYIISGLSVLLMLTGCVGVLEPKPEPKPEPKLVVEKKPVYHAPKRNRVVPPLPEREVDIDVDSAVDSAMGNSISEASNDAIAESLNADNAIGGGR